LVTGGPGQRDHRTVGPAHPRGPGPRRVRPGSPEPLFKLTRKFLNK
jgi:hypothetical protein